MNGARDEAARDEALPYGVDTIRLRITWPAAPVSQGYNGRMWRMRPLRGWTGGQGAGVARPDGEAIAPSALLAGGSDLTGAQRGRPFNSGLAQRIGSALGTQYAQSELFEKDETTRRVEPGEGPLSDAELFRLEAHGKLRSRLKEIDPESPELRKPYLTGRGGFVPTEADLDGLYQALKDARSRRPPPQGPVNTPADPGGPAPRLPPGPPDYSVGLPPSSGVNRGLLFVPENIGPPGSPAMREAYRYQAQTAGSSTNPATGQSAASPALRYDNPNPNGASIVRWDGIRVLPDGTIELIDAKTAVGIFPTRAGTFIPPSFREQLRRQSTALAQNPGYMGVIEVPTAQVAADARSIIDELEIRNISVRVRPSQP